jgi:putative transcriptional regulator
MSPAPSDLATPLLLVALPQVVDPFFHQALVLLIHHGEEGSLGIIVNRPTGISVREILEGMEVPWGGGEGELAYFGGPVQPQLGTVLFTPPGDDPAPPLQAASEIAPGVALTQHIADLGALAAAPPESFRLLLGYAGWGEGQLLEEILRNDWLIAPVGAALVFADQPEKAWEDALRSVGVDPDTLPSWTASGTDESAN